MSLKSTIKYCNVKDKLCFHLYHCHNNGYQLSISVYDMKKPYILDLTEEEALKMVSEFNEI